MSTETQTKTAELKPPGTLHEMLSMAIEDFRKILKDPLYRVNMNIWYKWDEDEGICYVCLGGAVISQRMKPKGHKLFWDEVSMEWSNALEALNLIRQGWIEAALTRYYFSGKSPGKLLARASAMTLLDKVRGGGDHPLANRDIEFNYANPEPFLQYLDEVHSHLKEAGI
jgi:hypothetical protein